MAFLTVKLGKRWMVKREILSAALLHKVEIYFFWGEYVSCLWNMYLNNCWVVISISSITSWDENATDWFSWYGICPFISTGVGAGFLKHQQYLKGKKNVSSKRSQNRKVINFFFQKVDRKPWKSHGCVEQKRCVFFWGRTSIRYGFLGYLRLEKCRVAFFKGTWI